MLQKTVAAASVKPSSHTVPHSPLWYTINKPSDATKPFTRLTITGPTVDPVIKVVVVATCNDSEVIDCLLLVVDASGPVLCVDTSSIVVATTELTVDVCVVVDSVSIVGAGFE